MSEWPDGYSYSYHTPTSSRLGGGGSGSSGKNGKSASSSASGKGNASLVDVSFAGSKIKIGGVLVNEFMDDANPIDIQDTDTCNIEWSCNGRMIRTVKPSAVMMSITVIPGSNSDRALQVLWKERFSNGGRVSLEKCDEPLSCSITLGDERKGKFNFVNGTCVAGAAALTANGQGKLGGNTYTFAFERVV